MTHEDDEPTPADPQAAPPTIQPDQFAELRAAPEPLSVHFTGFALSVSVPPALAVAAAGIFGEKLGEGMAKANRERLKGLDAVGEKIGKNLAKNLARMCAPIAARVEELAARIGAVEKAAAPPDCPPQPTPAPPECAGGIAPGVPLN